MTTNNPVKAGYFISIRSSARPYSYSKIFCLISAGGYYPPADETKKSDRGREERKDIMEFFDMVQRKRMSKVIAIFLAICLIFTMGMFVTTDIAKADVVDVGARNGEDWTSAAAPDLNALDENLFLIEVTGPAGTKTVQVKKSNVLALNFYKGTYKWPVDKEVTGTGVSLADLLEAEGIDTAGITSVVEVAGGDKPLTTVNLVSDINGKYNKVLIAFTEEGSTPPTVSATRFLLPITITDGVSGLGKKIAVSGITRLELTTTQRFTNERVADQTRKASGITAKGSFSPQDILKVSSLKKSSSAYKVLKKKLGKSNSVILARKISVFNGYGIEQSYNKAVKLTFKVSKKYNGQKLKLVNIHLGKNKTYTAKVKKGKVTFNVKSGLSDFVLGKEYGNISYKLKKSGISKIKVTWKGIKGAVKYQIANNHTGNGDFKTKHTSIKSSRTYFSIGKKANKTYKFKMRYCKIKDGKKVWSEWSKVKTIKL